MGLLARYTRRIKLISCHRLPFLPEAAEEVISFFNQSIIRKLEPSFRFLEERTLR